MARSCLMGDGMIRRWHEKGCHNHHYYLLSPQECGAVGAQFGRHCPLENMTIFMADMTTGWQIESQMGTCAHLARSNPRSGPAARVHHNPLAPRRCRSPGCDALCAQ